MPTHRFARIALIAGIVALSAAPARAEYMQLKLYSVKITSYSISGSGLDDLPGAPPKIAAAPKKPQPAPNGGKHAPYDFPGVYAQRFDGIDKGGKNETITIHGRYDMAHRLHRGRQTSSPTLRR
jgi:hypothetical protein